MNIKAICASLMPGAATIEVPVMVQFTIQKDGSVSAKYVEDGGGDVAP